MENLRDNLAEEQRAISETEFVCWKQVRCFRVSPLQLRI